MSRARILSAARRTWPVAPAAGAVLGLLLAGCASSPSKLSITSHNPVQDQPERPPVPPAEKAAAEKQAVRTAMLAKAEGDPKDARATIAAARGLRSDRRSADALQLLERSAAANPRDPNLQREQGLLSLETGQVAKAEKHLRKAVELGGNDWQTHSALGAALAAQGRHPEAQLNLAKALEMKPDHPSILNNLALSYALDNKPEEAEKVLRIAAVAKGSPAHIQQNLALVLGIRGNLPEAQKVAAAALPQAKSTANVAYLKSLAERGRADPAAIVSAKPADPALKSARAGNGLEKPYLLGFGAPQD